MSRVPLTVAGAERMREEIRVLKSEARPRIIQAIAEARGHGDLKENAEYHAAKEQQGFIEGRIRELEGQLGNADIIDVSRLVGTTKVVFGATVHLIDEDDGTKSRYQIVGEYEADMKQGRISITSPLARALIGKSEGDVASFVVPAGEKNLEIVRVEYL
ncbi:MAG: transcription elongation factor GreA [Gammaproteobacteria bacterium PRO9]|nr:transcription elongation factor GreA [Gammaproteobacteria bacterium PRO9]